MNLDEIKELIRLMNEHQIGEIDIESEGERVRLKAQEGGRVMIAAPETATAPAPAAGAPPAPAEPEEPSGTLIRSPLVGIFYAAPGPDKPPFVEEGSEVEESTVVCIVEAMKVMNEIKAEVTGRVTKVLVENGQPVEYGQPLFQIEAAQ